MSSEQSKMGNRGIWLKEDGSLSVRDLEMPGRPREGEALIRILYSGINPADTKHAHIGVYDTAAGYDFCGVVEEAGSGYPFKAGDIVAGATPTGKGRPKTYGTHQNYIMYPNDGNSFKVPDNLPHDAASVLQVVVHTAADALFNRLQYPDWLERGRDMNAPQLEALLIWGASSAVGICAIQLARQIGVRHIIVTASPERHELLTKLGATKCFDYKAKDVVEDIKQYAADHLPGKAIRRAIDAAGQLSPPGTAELTMQCCAPVSEGTIAAGVTAMRVPGMVMPLAALDVDVHFHISPGPGDVTVKALPEFHKVSHGALLWAVKEYGRSFEMPVISVHPGSPAEKAAEIVAAVGQSRAAFGKHTIKHPIA